MKKLLFFIISLIFCISEAGSVPAYPYPIDIQQPDGTFLTINLHGDENRKIRTTADGIVIMKNKEGFYSYAIKNNDNKIIAGERIARNPERRNVSDKNYVKQAVKIDELKSELSVRPQKIKRAPSAISNSNGFPRTGSPRSLVILVNFKDKAFTVPSPNTAFENLLNQENYSGNGGTGSARDYFIAASYGQFNPQFDVVGPYTLPNNMAYYGKNDDKNNDEDIRPTQMIVDACKAADNAGLDFRIYDTDNDGYIDNVFVYYAGYNEAEYGSEDSIWPHRWVIQRGYNYTGSEASITFDGKKVFDYACTSELRGNSGSNMCGIGTFTHEFGHVIGLPDYYHTEDDKDTLDDWSIMDAGAYLNQGRTPPTYSAYDRFYLGWLAPEELNSPADKSLYPISQTGIPIDNTSKQAYILSATTHNLIGDNPSPKEFFVMEYRKKTGWDTFLPAEGLLFWHIDYDADAWEDNSPNNYNNDSQTLNSHMRVYLQPLSGSDTTPGTAFTSGSFNPTTWAGNAIDREITDITKSNDSISFKIMGGAPYIPPQGDPKINVAVVNEVLSFSTTKPGNANIKHLKIKTTDLYGDLSVSLSGAHSDMFFISINSIPFENANSKDGEIITVKFEPSNIGIYNAILTISGGGLEPAKVIQLNGISTE